ncbi:MAG: MFS transporter [Anaerolineae bacterium CG_4_9_14_3_um_filter_57_17]|nr:MFS transporter [bacterium]NCT20606.1 MFS transporter [bacterium]PJB68461.1 MAG: MFS transporter [Anaerolineae bacterium CG_4_9_14_3_um_filter_57_17]
MRLPPAFKHPKFTLLWAGLLISIAGSQMQLAAIHWHIRELSGKPDPLALGLIGLARILPVIVFSLFGGAFADTFNRRTIILVTQTLMALTAAGLAWLTFSGSIQIWQIYALTALQAAAVAFDGPARQAIVPNLVPAEHLPSAFSLNSIAFNAGAVIGPVLSGVVIATLGQSYTYFFNAPSFLAVIAALLMIGSIPQDLQKGSGISLAAIGEGVRFIFSRKIILSTMVMDFFATFFASANTMMPIIAKDILQVGEVGYGWLVSAQSIGSVTAGVVISQLPGLRRQGPIFLTAVVIFGVATVAFGLTTSFALAFVALLIVGAADTVSTIIRNTIRQLQTPDHIRGRMTSVNQIFFQGGPQLGEVESGLVATAFGVPFAIISGGIGTILAAALIVWKWPELRTYDK